MNENDKVNVEDEIRQLASQHGVAREVQEPDWTDRVISSAMSTHQSRRGRALGIATVTAAAVITMLVMVFTPNLKNNHPMVSPTSASPTSVQTQVREASPLSSGGIHELVTESERILAGQLSSVSGNDFTLIVERTLLGRGEANIQMDLTSSCHIEPANFSKGRAAAFVTTTGGVWLYVLNDTEYTSVCSTQSSPLGQFTQAEFNTALAGLAE